MGRALVETIAQLEAWTAETGLSGPSYYNFAVTDGQSVAAIRYVSDPRLEPQSLYYSIGGKYDCQNGVCKFSQCAADERAVIVASERLTADPNDWFRVAPNHILMIEPNLSINVELMHVARVGSHVLAER
jgi:predicted glutamine amidotransferase